MYTSTLIVHSLLRWLALVLGAMAIVHTLRARSVHTRAALGFVIALDVQLLLGILLYVAISPTVHAALASMPAAMHHRGLRFWAVEHPTLAVGAVIAAHVGRVVARKRGGARGVRALVFAFALALVLLVLATPWPFLAHGRPWFRFA